ncbi:polysaccharide pyruvyl transferase family protein [Paenibacillus sp. MER TA 81-3]|uniref:polysaccharide pyruvyl transferase family protein n=1 Tax=Paenibacillus sp. MER TA 81-3 TaxID=2939573 RepID=UPI00203D7CB2|nr:polysaccharide pyruvyl transferase family protein [Paenibacillus sp. MER TA 81-3]MCM3342847.1 polysaccharide pyruvyl transferase family protein [Paenibacillus sp. MER TA 81-3]
MKNIFYLGWIGFNNLGDEWMWAMFEHMAQLHLSPEKYKVIPSMPGVDIKNLSVYDTIVMGGGSLLIPGYLDILHEAVRQEKRVIIWGSGHDRLNPFSFGPGEPAESKEFCVKVQEVVENTAFCGVRGPWTFEYMRQMGVSMDRVTVSGDPAMLTSPPASHADDEETRERWIGINWGTSYNRIYGKDEAYVENQLASAASFLIEQGYKIYLYPVWGPDREACKRLYDKIAAPDKVVYDAEVHTYEHYLQLMKRFDLTINFKLHANVLSAAANVPFICLGYRFKSFDFTHSLSIPQLVISTDATQLAERILKAADYVQANKMPILNQIDNHRQSVIAKLEQPFLKQLF